MDLICRIRKKYGLDIVVGDEDASQAIEGLSDSLQAAVQNVSEELYSKTTHFVLELIQNADDNEYPDGTTPELSMKLDGSRMAILCNERGFNEAEVRAICDIGKSTKKGVSGYIGEKGIGFKSVFTVADVVRVQSGPYSFMLDKREPLGMIAPIWVGGPKSSGSTRFNLELSPRSDRKKLIQRLQDIQPSLLLFLHKLHRIEISIDGVPSVLEKREIDGITRVHRKHRDNPVTKDYFLSTSKVSTVTNEPKRAGVTQSELVLAFPLTQTGEPLESEEEVYAFLPLRSYGLRFVVQADFLTAANREDILDCEWNRQLRDSISAAVIDAIDTLKRRHALRYNWLRYLRSTTQAGFFKNAHSKLIATLRDAPVLLSYDGESYPPSHMLVLPAQYRDTQEGGPLIPALYLNNRWYLHQRYDTSKDAEVLMALGVKEMSADDFLHGLFGMQRDGLLHEQTENWWEGVCTALLPLRNRDDIRHLKLVPLVDGQWTSVSEGNSFFSSSTTDIPRDLGLRMVSNINPVSSHYKLLHLLGIKDAKLGQVVEMITTLHSGSDVLLNSRPALASHARFLFKHRFELPRRRFTENGGRICVVTTENKIVPASEVYMDLPKHGSFPLSQCFKSPRTHFIHADYLASSGLNTEEHEDWIDWLQTAFGVRSSPQIDDTGLSPEFRDFVRTAPTKQVLLFLKEYSEEIRARLKRSENAQAELRALEVTATNSSRCPLKATYIARGALTQFRDLPFLPIAEPEDCSWDFLREFGVTLKVDGMLYLKELIRLSQIPPAPIRGGMDPMLELARGHYRQLAARYTVEGLGESINNAFGQHALIYVPPRNPIVESASGSWKALGESAIVWDGPPSMRTRYPLKTAYSELREFFCDHVGVPNCPDDILLQELQQISDEVGQYRLEEEDHVRVHQILHDIDDMVENTELSDAIAGAMLRQEMQRVRFIPARTPQNELRLFRLLDTVYLPDPKHIYADMFQNQVPIVTSPPDASGGTLSSLYRLFDGVFKTSFARRLDKAIRCTIEGQGEHQVRQNEVATRRYQSSIPFIERIAESTVNREDAGSIRSLVQSMQDMRVVDIRSHSIMHTYVLTGAQSVIRHRPIGLYVEEHKVRLIVGRGCSWQRRDTLASREFSRLCPAIRAMEFFTMFTHGPAVLNDLDPPSALIDRDEEPNGFHDDALSSQASFELSHGSDTTDDVRLSPTMTRHVLNGHATNGDPSYPSEYQPSTEAQYRAGYPQYRLNPPSTIGVPDPILPDIRLPTRPNRVRRISQPTGDQDQSGFDGESMMFDHFVETMRLPDFTLNNWTSELRRYRGFPEFIADAPADFIYRDAYGILTKWLFGPVCAERWRDRYPIYFMEVKATTGVVNECFHMSPRQLDAARDMSIPRGAEDRMPPPLHVYVLLRVWSVASEPWFRAYRDPWRLLCEGRMRHVSEVDLAILP